MARPDARSSQKRRWLTRAARVLLPAAVASALLSAVAGGLVRAGVALPAAVHGPWLGQAVSGHAFLMMVAFMGTVIGLERAVALKRAWALAAPLASACAGVALLAGAGGTAALLAVAAAGVFLVVNLAVVTRQPAGHAMLLFLAAAAWLIGNLALLAGYGMPAVMPWWFAFLVMTIGAERLEMARLMRRRPGASTALATVLLCLLLGAAGSLLGLVAGVVLYGLALLSMAAWLLTFDMARRTVGTAGLSRYMAVCLLTGYVWLAVAGVGWAAMAFGLPTRDVALHALGLGFVFSMMLGHAPIVLPALLRVKVLFGWPFYLAFALLHGTLVVRLLAGSLDTVWLSRGATGNALAILAFVATMTGAALAWRLRHGPPQRQRHAAPARP